MCRISCSYRTSRIKSVKQVKMLNPIFGNVCHYTITSLRAKLGFNVICNFFNINCRVRVIGSATLALCHLASGAADAYYQFGLHCWDLAAATVIIREAGGVVIDTSGKQIYFKKDKV